MARSRYPWPYVAVVALIPGFQLVQSLSMEYCASINTGSTSTYSSIYQSNGLCHDYCLGKSFAFAILQHHNCWCSNYVPAKSEQVDTDECSDTCPGWPQDTCGADGLYGYIALGVAPSGTTGGSTSTSTAQISTTTVKTSSTVTSEVDSTTTTSSTSSSDTNTKTTSTSTEDNASTTEPPNPTTSVKTITAGGTISLETVTVTPTPAAGAASGSSTSSHGLSAGATAGIAIGVIALAAIAAAIAVFFYFQHKKRQREEELASRPHSHLSGSAGMMSTPTTAMASVWDGENTSTGRRNSRLMPHDPRMDPFATNIYSRFENKSRESINTLQDNQDYSRKVLRTTNPDPPDN